MGTADRDVAPEEPAGASCDALTVYYDGACPLCRREIAFYRRRADADEVAFVDISSETDPAALPSGVSREELLGRFHVMRPDGELESGAAGFAALWRRTRGFRRAGRLAQLPGITALADIAYGGFLKLRPGLQRLVRRLERP